MIQLAFLTFIASAIFLIGFEGLRLFDVSALIKFPIYIGLIFTVVFGYIRATQKILSAHFFD